MKKIALFFLLISAVGCRGKAPKSAIAWEQKAPYVQGTVLRHVPASCSGGSFYVDLPAVMKNEATSATADSMARKLARDFDKEGAGKELEKAFGEVGFEPLRDTRELAICYRNDDSTVFVMGGELSGKDLFGAVQKAIERTHDEVPPVENVNGVPTISLGKLKAARVAPNVLVLSEDRQAAARLSKPYDRSAEWGWAPGRIMVANIAGTENLRVSLAESGADVDLLASARTKMSQPDLEKLRDRVAKRLEDTPLKLLAKPALTTKIDVGGGQATYSVRLPAAVLGETVRIITDLPPGEMKKIIGYLLAPESNEQKI